MTIFLLKNNLLWEPKNLRILSLGQFPSFLKMHLRLVANNGDSCRFDLQVFRLAELRGTTEPKSIEG